MADPGSASVQPGAGRHTIATVRADDLPELLELMRAYCDFYASSPSDQALIALARALLDAPLVEGLQLIARDRHGSAVGFATVFWSWDTTEAARIGIMHDLYVAPGARGSGLAERLIEQCRLRCRGHEAVRLDWQTAAENHRAQAVYGRVGGVRGPWLAYSLAI